MAAMRCSGDTIARLYEAAGFDVTREYYFNDGGRQMKLLGESVRARYLQAHGIDAPMPPDGYQGEYIVDIARALKAERGDSLVSVTDLEIFRSVAVKAIFADINQTCTRLGIRFDVFTNELDLFNAGKVDACPEGAARRGSHLRAGRRDIRCAASRLDFPRMRCWCAPDPTSSRLIARPTSPITSRS